MIWKDTLQLVCSQGGPGFSHFAITNLCDAHCSFCNFAVGNLKPQEMRSVSCSEGIETIDILYRNGIRYLIFVGGEPLLHKDLLTFSRHATNLGMTAMVCTNGSRLTPEYIHEMQQAGMASVIISVDAPAAEVHEKNRGLGGVCEKIRIANQALAQARIQSTASVTLSKLMTLEDYDRLPAFLKFLGFTQVTFSYPLETLGSSYLSFSDSNLVHYTAAELSEVLDKVSQLKKHIHVLNNHVAIAEMQKFLRREPQAFGCLGGYRYFYVDWKLDIYRCHYWQEPMCHIREFGPDKLIRDDCQMCMIDCYRDPSVMQHIAVAITDVRKLVGEHKWYKAWRTIFNKKTWLSLKAVMEQLRWIRKM
jgi:MoaA/NifB/PqqE/SkfB family radical SAM enzyme